MQPLTLTNRGDVLTSSLTDAEAATALDRVPTGHGSKQFASSLAADLRRYGNLFPAKRFWLHKLAIEQLDRENPAPPVELPATGELPKIAAFLTPVSNRLKSGARVTFVSGPLTVVIKRAGQNSRYPGHFHVEGISGFGDTPVYMGRISDKGHWFPSRQCAVEVFALLDEFESNPAEHAAAYGRRTGRCAFCDLVLDDPVSCGFGYGPHCAKNYLLPHGKRALAAMTAKRAERETAEAVA